jgi:hypothetical protein
MTNISSIFLTEILALQLWIMLTQKSITILPRRMEIKHHYSHLSWMQILLHPNQEIQLKLHRNGRTSLNSWIFQSLQSKQYMQISNCFGEFKCHEQVF